MGELRQLFDEVGRQGTADTAVRECHEVAVLPDNAPFLNQTFVDIDLADVVHDHSEAYALTVVQDVVQKSCLSAAKIACEQQHG